MKKRVSKKNSKFSSFRKQIFVIIALIHFLDLGPVFAEISVNSYCHLTIQTLQQQLPITQEIIAIVKQYQNYPLILEDQLRLKRVQLEDARLALYESFGTNADEYVAYMSANRRKVEAYLDANPDIRQQIEDLSIQLKQLMAQEDELMELMAVQKNTLLLK